MRKYCEIHNRNHYEDFCPECSTGIKKAAGETASMFRNALTEPFRIRAEETEKWLREQQKAADPFTEQRHLDAGTRERAYWHHGYLMALRDVIARLGTGPTGVKE